MCLQVSFTVFGILAPCWLLVETISVTMSVRKAISFPGRHAHSRYLICVLLRHSDPSPFITPTPAPVDKTKRTLKLLYRLFFLQGAQYRRRNRGIGSFSQPCQQKRPKKKKETSGSGEISSCFRHSGHSSQGNNDTRDDQSGLSRTIQDSLVGVPNSLSSSSRPS